VRKDFNDSGKVKLEAMLLTRQKEAEGDRTLKISERGGSLKQSGRNFRAVNEYTEHARAIGLNLHIREDAHLR
jgi:hypothetical protein